ncbi:MAG: MFS transporter [Phycisphaerales bacterium]
MSEATTEPAAPPQRGVFLLFLLVFLACLPDAMLPPALRPMVVERLGATEPQAHWFMAINLAGALIAVPVLSRVRRIVPPLFLVIVGAAANSALLAALALATTLPLAMLLRGLEGVADVVVLAALFDLAAKAGPAASQGRRMGLASTALMLGLAGGAATGALVGGTPTTVLLLGASFCAVLALCAGAGRAIIERIVDAAPPRPDAAPSRLALRNSPPLWPIALMMGSDRMLAGLLTSTLPLLLASRLGWSPERIGGMLALPLLLMALGAGPAGIVADRAGNLFTRTCAALAYALALAVAPMTGAISGGLALPSLLATMLVLGLAASALMPSEMALAARTGRGAVAMGACQVAGNVGYLVGIAGAGWLLLVLGGPSPARPVYTMVIQLFALAHVVVTGVTMLESRRGAGRSAAGQAE